MYIIIIFSFLSFPLQQGMTNINLTIKCFISIIP